MAGSMAENWRKIGSASADDMAMKICYSVIVQNWAMAVNRPWSEWQQFAPGAFFCPFLRKEDPIWHKVVRNCGTMKSRDVIRPAAGAPKRGCPKHHPPVRHRPCPPWTAQKPAQNAWPAWPARAGKGAGGRPIRLRQIPGVRIRQAGG